MRILALDAAGAGCSAAVMVNGTVLAERSDAERRGQAAMLPPMAQDVLREAGVAASLLDVVAATVGPGSFTGVRAALALAQGIALAAGARTVGVTVAEAMAEAAGPVAGRTLWTAVDSLRGRVFLDRGAGFATFSLDRLPEANGPLALAGDAALSVAAHMAARGADIMLTDARLVHARLVARAALRRLTEGVPTQPLRPLYIDPPEAKLPTNSLRPQPSDAASGSVTKP